MEFILLLIGAGVAYYLYVTLQDYLKNPLHQEIVQQKLQFEVRHTEQVSEQEKRQNKVRESEYGILSAILGIFARSDGKMCEFERVLVEDMIDEMARDSKNSKITKDALLEIYENGDDRSLEQLCVDFSNATKGEYKKRLKVVEFLFVLAYADGEFDKNEEAMLIDVAAFFELDNEDFNKLYNEFATSYAKDVEMSTQEALELLGLQEGYSQEELEKHYNDMLKKTKGTILDNQNMNKSLLDSTVQDLRKIETAYSLLKSVQPKTQDL
ncbi:TerB family tellurite resistance protein [uncultured Helicobacter sp.]|uniref:TerB family tellurite resistance protein n=1 Tax=uncultured Helicobacter sp. TaxID=175537 RepID=UPI00374EA525